MKRILLSALPLLALCLMTLESRAQSGAYGNEWIDYSKTYYKFKVGKAGVYRISRAALDAAGLPSGVTSANFMLFRDGLEIPVFVSPANDYIEFVGRPADGTLDKELYENPAWQPDTRISLFTDTAAYFLTWDNAANHLRLAATANTIPVTPPAPEVYNWTTVGNYYKNTVTKGQSYDTSFNGVGNEFYSPSFDIGEGFVNSTVPVNNTATISLPTPNVAAAPVNASLRTAITTQAYHLQFQASVAVNNVAVANGAARSYDTRHLAGTIPAGQLTANNTISYALTASGTVSGSYDVYGVSYAELEYPRNYDVAGLTMHTFRLGPSSAAQYLEFTNFSSPARLYDITSRLYYEGDVQGNKTRFYLPASASDRQFTLVATTAATTLDIAKTVRFTDYGNMANQGDYIILTHSRLMQPSPSSNNIIADYKSYRASAAGGAHQVQIADVTELYDQFGYGYDMHPQSIRHFLQYAYTTWTTRPVAVNIVGHGLQYDQYKTYFANPGVYTFPVVPVYGSPGSDVDFVNFGNPRTQKLQIGRVSVWNTAEVAQYLEKVKGYETALHSGSDVNALWKKRVMHLAGGTTVSELNQFMSTLDYAAEILRDTLMGAEVNSFGKGSTSAIEPVTVQQVNALLNNGQSTIAYLGHASPNRFEYELPAVGTYNAGPRVPVFVAMGCDIAQMFTVASAPAAPSKTLSESYTLAPTSGAIALIATDNYGYTGYLDNYLFAYDRSMAYQHFGGTVGLHSLAANNAMLSTYASAADWRFYFTQIECQILTGDPGVATFGPAKPDYHVANDGITAIPANVSSAADSFQLRIIAYSLGRSTYDTVKVRVEHVNPAGATSEVKTYSIPRLLNTDTSYVWVPVNKISDLGLNRYRITIDPQNRFDESDELNNVAELTQFIYSDNLVPVYPHEFAIVYKQGVTLKASTLNPFRSMARYIIELDTTTAFNSPQKLQTTITSLGGLIKWTPNLTMKDSTVYYWRSSIDSVINGDRQWSGSSFVYLANGSDGWNQSHYFQYKRDSYDSLNLGADRRFRYDVVPNTFQFYNAVIFDRGSVARVMRNTLENLQRRTQSKNGIFVVVIDSLSGKPWVNAAGDTRGAYAPVDLSLGTYVREYDMGSLASRTAARDYIESVPNGNYIMIKSVVWNSEATSFIDAWKADTVQAGSGRSLYHTIYNLGFTKVDSFTRKGSFLFMKKKGSAANMTEQWVGNVTDSLFYSATIDGYKTNGHANSTVIGPASSWQTLKIRQRALDLLKGQDLGYVSVYGITAANRDTLLFNTRRIDTTSNLLDTSLTAIPAGTYPRLRLVWRTMDTISTTAPQLDYWRVHYTPLPEAALNSSAHFVFADSLQVGQQELLSVAIENLTDIPFRDSMLVTYKVINANGVSSLLQNVRYKKLAGLDTLHATISFDPAAYPGHNNLFIEANPNNDQPEQYHPNNLGYLPFNIGVDKNNPLLDVTFDGVHILNRDIVSAKPFIKISLKDDNKYLALDDTALVSMALIKTGQKGDQVRKTIPLRFDGSLCKFIPGETGPNGKNTAYIEIRPDLADDVYTLELTGRDKSRNLAGTPQGSSSTGAKYTVDFEVISQATVTNVLNYPNPFSTSTAFLFTITGSQVPSQFKIQILSVTGKVVREITKAELGPLHIGRNITEYKWDGRDQYGQLLGNGVYMYRVATSLNGEQLEHRSDGADRFFKNGYGKMYLMR